MAKDMKISAPTLHRIEAGNDCDSDTFVKLIVWLVTPEPEIGNG